MAALIGPLFIDWTAYRVEFERQAEKLVGREVKILGDADAFLLPTPSVTFTDMRVGDADNPLMIVSRFSARIELAPLLKGEIRVIDMTFERPDLRLVVDTDGHLTTFGAPDRNGAVTPVDPADVQFEQVEVIDGSVRLSDARSAQVHQIKDIDATIAARALIGPFKADGTLTAGGGDHRFKLATGKLRPDGAIRVKLQVNPEATPVELLLDGKLSATDLKPRYDGTFQVSRLLPKPPDDTAEITRGDLRQRDGTPWRAEGKFDFTGSSLSVTEYELTYGPEDRRFSLTGTGNLSLAGEPRFDLAVNAKQIDLDRMLNGGTAATSRDAAGAVQQLLSGLNSIPRPDIDGRIRAEIPGLVVAGGAVQNLAFEAITTTGGWYLSGLNARLPGRGQLQLSGDISLGRRAGFKGDMTLSVEQPAALASWWRGGGSLAGATLDPLEVQGHLTVGQTGVALTDARLRTDLSLGTGTLSWRPPRGPTNAAFVLDINADRFELAQLGAAARLALASYGTDSDGITDVDVRIRVGTLLTDDVEASGVEMVVSFSGDTLRIDRMILADLAGARVVADGTIKHALTTPDGDLELAITADKLDGVTSLIIDLFPDSDLAQRLTTASGMLGPAILSATLSGRADGDKSDVKLDVSGDLAGSELKVLGTFSGRVDKWREAATDVTAALSGPDSARLLGQLGFDILPLSNIPAGRIAISAKGQPNDGLTVEGTIDVAGTAISLKGAATFLDAGDVLYGFETNAESADLATLALLTGRVLPIIAGSVPASLTATIDGNAAELRLEDLSGSVAGVALRGGGAVDLKADIPRFKGNLTLDEVDLRFLTELAFGADTWTSQAGGEAIWPSGPFGAPLLGFVSADVTVAAKRMWLTDKLSLDGTTFRLDVTPNGLALDDVAGRLMSGKAGAALQIKRSDEGEAVLSANVKVTDGDLTEIVWRDGDQPRATGRFDLAVDLNSTGRSIASMVSALAGGGTLTIKNGRIEGIDPDAFNTVTGAVDNELPLEEIPVRQAFEKRFFQGGLEFTSVETVLSVASGTVRARNMTLAADTVRALGSAALDLNNFSFESDWTIGAGTAAESVAGATPQVVLRFDGAVDDPAVAVDIAPFLSYLTLRAYEKEVDRVEALQAEIIERDRLTRELRRLREAKRRREAEIRRKKLAEEARNAQEAEEKARRNRAREQQSEENETTRPPASNNRNRGNRTSNRPRIELPTRPSATRTFEDQVRDLERRSGQASSLAPLPRSIDIAPPPGARRSGSQPGQPSTIAPTQPGAGTSASGPPLQLRPQSPTTAAPARRRQRRQRIIQAPGDRIIIMPEYDPSKQRYIESSGDRLIRMPN